MTKYQILLILLFMNTVTALGYVVVMGAKKQLKKGILMGVYMILVPVAGPLSVFFSYLFFRVLRHTKAAYINPAEISFRREKMRIIEGDSLARGINKVPLEEALLESDNENTRKVLLDVLKSDFGESISILMKAIENEDTEVSHYASAAISDVLSKFKKHQREFDEQYRDHGEDEELLTAYRKYVFRFLSYDIFPKTEEGHYLDLCSELMENSYQNSCKIKAEEYEKWIDLLLKKDREEAAREWLKRLQKDYPESLSAYKAELKLSYRLDHDNFRKCLEKIKNSPVMLDGETLEIVRFFNWYDNADGRTEGV